MLLECRLNRNCSERCTNGLLQLAACLDSLLKLVDGVVVLLKHVLNALRILLLQLGHLHVHLVVLLRLLNHLLTQLFDVLALLSDVALLLILRLVQWISSCGCELGRPTRTRSIGSQLVLCDAVENLCTFLQKNVRAYRTGLD